MDFFSIIMLLCGLTMFLFGMDLMEKNMSKAAGGKLERILGKLTADPVIAVLLGASVTAVIQSSSATTVMVVGFVNSGIMTLHQAVGIIMGANIGTTITSWILSLAGIESNNFFIRLLKPDSFAPAMGLAGVVLYLFGKRQKRKCIGGILTGFAVLMTGMEAMSRAMEPLKEIPAFTDLFMMFTNPVFGMLTGALLTAVIQSSSASIGILQALCTTGAVSCATVVPIIMGQNIGTCVTAMISAARAGTNAKRAAYVHLYFNLIGTVLFMCVFYMVHLIRSFDFMEKSVNAAGIAAIHSIFNIVTVLMLFPFRGGLERLACITVREKKVEKGRRTGLVVRNNIKNRMSTLK